MLSDTRRNSTGIMRLSLNDTLIQHRRKDAMCVNKFNKTMCHALNNTIHISKKCGWQTLKAFNQSDLMIKQFRWRLSPESNLLKEIWAFKQASHQLKGWAREGIRV